jgi:hypothetical protein
MASHRRSAVLHKYINYFLKTDAYDFTQRYRLRSGALDAAASCNVHPRLQVGAACVGDLGACAFADG